MQSGNIGELHLYDIRETGQLGIKTAQVRGQQVRGADTSHRNTQGWVYNTRVMGANLEVQYQCVTAG